MCVWRFFGFCFVLFGLSVYASGALEPWSLELGAWSLEPGAWSLEGQYLNWWILFPLFCKRERQEVEGRRRRRKSKKGKKTLPIALHRFWNLICSKLILHFPYPPPQWLSLTPSSSSPLSFSSSLSWNKQFVQMTFVMGVNFSNTRTTNTKKKNRKGRKIEKKR